MLAYNVKMLREAGVDPASLRTYSGFLSAAKKLTRDRNGDGRVDQWMIYLNIEPIWWQRFFDFYTLYVAASCGRTLIEGNRAAFNNRAGVAAMGGFLLRSSSGGLRPEIDLPRGGRVPARKDGYIHNRPVCYTLLGIDEA